MKKTPFTNLISSDVSTLRKYPVAIIGGGGKSTLMLALAKELLEQGLRVVLTCTTKFQPPQKTALVLQKHNDDYLDEANILLDELKVVAIGSDYYHENRISGVHKNSISQIRQIADVEAELNPETS